MSLAPVRCLSDQSCFGHARRLLIVFDSTVSYSAQAANNVIPYGSSQDVVIVHAP